MANISRRDFLKGSAAGVLSVVAGGMLGGTASAEESVPVPDTSVSAASELISWRTPPEKIAESEFKEVYISDIVIVGAGNAGMVAGVAAAQAGASVTIVEKMGAIGTTRYHIGTVGSKYQKAAGVEINKAEIVEEICKYASHNCDQKLVRLWADESGATIDWLGEMMEELGYEMVMETDCGNEEHGFYKTFPTCHNLQALIPADAIVGSMQDASILPGIAENLVGFLSKAGGKILFNTPMEQLIQNAEGRVIGVVCKDADGDYVAVYGKKAVMICTGGYAYNEEMMADMNPYDTYHCTTMEAYPGNNGDGLKAALWIGADKQDIPTTMVFDRGGVPAGTPCGNMYKQSGIMTHIGSQPFLKVNHDGKRFANESVPYDFIYHAAAQEPLSTYCMIFDGNWREQTRQFHTIGCSRIQPSPSGNKYVLATEDFTEFFLNNILGPAGVFVQADTLEELAEKLLLPKDAFLATVERYNELCEKGIDEDFGKESYRMLPLGKAPYYGVTLGGQLLGTLDGLRVNTNLQVLDKQHQVIPGLYAGGNDTGGFFSGNYPELIVGLAMGRTVTFARIAGENMAKEEGVEIDAVEFRKQPKEIVGADGNGTFSSTKQGLGGDVTVTCTFENGKLVDATITGDHETPDYGGKAIPMLLGELLESGSPTIDAVSGASITSTAVISAAKECFQLAGVAF
ncbi:MAG: FAD-dependent oxidoreductase [Oscillospiraceae bacterium]|nr:FAD-dependent oxidoreductase [Oscillospiraceae bacterium]